MLTYLNRPWVLVTSRSDNICVACDGYVKPSQPIYRPLREGPRVKRYQRMCKPCGDRVGTPLENPNT